MYLRSVPSIRFLSVLLLAFLGSGALAACAGRPAGVDSEEGQAQDDVRTSGQFECVVSNPLGGAVRELSFGVQKIGQSGKPKLAGTSLARKEEPIAIFPAGSPLDAVNLKISLANELDPKGRPYLSIKGGDEYDAVAITLFRFTEYAIGKIELFDPESGDLQFASRIDCDVQKLDEAGDAEPLADGGHDANALPDGGDGGVDGGPVPPALLYGCGGIAGLVCPPPMRCVQTGVGVDRPGRCE